MHCINVVSANDFKNFLCHVKGAGQNTRQLACLSAQTDQNLCSSLYLFPQIHRLFIRTGKHLNRLRIWVHVGQFKFFLISVRNGISCSTEAQIEPKLPNYINWDA